jgi:hypothetical protein
MFRVPVGKLLDFIISYRGIKANPKKIEAILRMEPPRSYKKVQKLGVLIMQSYPNISSIFVGFRLGTGPDSPYKYEGVRPIGVTKNRFTKHFFALFPYVLDLVVVLAIVVAPNLNIYLASALCCL